jgi:hypothetical protein
VCSVAFSRFINFYGQRGARLTNDQTIYGAKPKRTWLIKILSILLFQAPEMHLRGTHGRRMFGLCTEIPLNRTGIRLHGFHYLSAQVGAFYPEAADRLGGIRPIREYSPVVSLQLTNASDLYRAPCCSSPTSHSWQYQTLIPETMFATRLNLPATSPPSHPSEAPLPVCCYFGNTGPNRMTLREKS